MYDPTNPYASPLATDVNPVAVQWLGTPSPSLQRVATGLALVYASVLVILLAIVGGGLIGGVIGAMARNPNAVPHAIDQHRALFIAIFLVGMTGRVLNLVGSLFCLATPPESRAQGLILISVAATIAAIAVQLGIVFRLVSEDLNPVQLILIVIAGLTFVLFLQRTALFIGRSDLAGRAKSIFIWFGIVLIMIVAIFGLALNGAPRPGGDEVFVIVGLLSIASLITGLVTVARYANLLAVIRKAILSGGRG
jgi:hypothetical protein